MFRFCKKLKDFTKPNTNGHASIVLVHENWEVKLTNYKSEPDQPSFTVQAERNAKQANSIKWGKLKESVKSLTLLITWNVSTNPGKNLKKKKEIFLFYSVPLITLGIFLFVLVWVNSANAHGILKKMDAYTNPGKASQRSWWGMQFREPSSAEWMEEHATPVFQDFIIALSNLWWGVKKGRWHTLLSSLGI